MEHPLEAKRLSEKVDADLLVNQYLSPYLHEVNCFIDIGCGPATVAYAISQQYPNINVYCLDINFHRLCHFIQQKTTNNNSVYSVVANTLQIPFSQHKFDFVFSRFLFEYIREPEQAMQEMIRILKPGGRIFVQDIDGQLTLHYPQPAFLENNIQKIINTMKLYGFDPFVGRKLYNMMFLSHLSDIDVKVEPYNLTWGKKKKEHIEQWIHKMNVLKPLVIEALGTESKADQMIEASIQFYCREETLLYTSLFSVTAIKPESTLNPTMQK